MPKDLSARTHGIVATYGVGCRCVACTAAKCESLRQYAATVKARSGAHPTTLSRRRRTKTIVCEQCNTTAEVQYRSSGRFCSKACAGRAMLTEHRPRKPRELMLYRRSAPVRREPVHARGSRRFTSGRCRVCGTWFVSQYMQVTCSEECDAVRQREVKRMHRARRRARKREAFVANVSPRKVFEADGYRCHLCRRKTNPKFEVPHPLAPTVDHVIPLAKGGTHEPLNCRTACFECNCAKRELGGGEQLLLIA